MPLLEARKTYKPFEYPWAYEFWKRQQQIHWMPEEVPLGEDCRDWAQKISEHERNLLTQIFRFFTQADIEVQDCYHDKYGRVFKPTEIKMMLAAFSNMETVHIAAYSHLLDTIGMPESEYGMFLEYEEMRAKHDYLAPVRRRQRRGHRPHAGDVRRLHRRAAAVRQLRHADELPALQQDEGHGPDHQLVGARREPALRRHHPAVPRLLQERKCLTKAVKEDIIDMCQKTVRLEDAFIDLAFEQGPVPGMSAKEIKRYIRYIADWRLGQLGLPAIYMVDDHPLPWLAPLLNGVEHANFFETRATEYSKAATRGRLEHRLVELRPAATRPRPARRTRRARATGRGCLGTLALGRRRRSRLAGCRLSRYFSALSSASITASARPAHFHASYQGFEALIAIETGEVYAGIVAERALRIVQDWAERHREELLANWQRGVDLLPMEMIPELTHD